MTILKTQYARTINILCAFMLFLAIFKLPISYYQILRIVVFTGALLGILRSIGSHKIWVFIFLVIAILFNPFFPVYLYQKTRWIPVDIISGILFLIAFIPKKAPPQENRQKSPEKNTYSRDRII